MVMGVAATGILLASSAMAADQKIAVVNFQEVMQKIPQTAALMQSLELEFKDDAITEIDKLEEQMSLTYELPLDFMTG